jgi:hypothetical protein
MPEMGLYKINKPTRLVPAGGLFIKEVVFLVHLYI